MGTALEQQRQKWIALGRRLFRPMLAVSVVLHVILLTLPLFPPEAEPEEPEPEEEEIQLSTLTPLLRPSPPPSPPPSPVAPPPQAVVPPPTAAPPPPAPVPSPVPTPQPTPTPQASPEPQPSPSPVTATPTPLSQEEQQLQDYLGQFQSDLQGLAADETAGLGIPHFNFPQPELIFTRESLAAANADPTLAAEQIAGVETILWASRRRPDELLSELQSRFEGFTFTPVQPYGGGEVYEVKKGATVRYINLIRAKDRTATFVVIWTRNPSLPVDQSPTPAASGVPTP